MNFELEQNEAQFIIQILGELQVKSGAWPLLVKLHEQYETQRVGQKEQEIKE